MNIMLDVSKDTRDLHNELKKYAKSRKLSLHFFSDYLYRKAIENFLDSPENYDLNEIIGG